ncbi:Piso0_000477 [Millerozyma farinosa CBS 7064]|uniref:Piso0_000477 protein n=1 Tax=Pichia sorbitophila (strain ATCC MYA-4447 / BCRC 22081 / CBS 7064 / NBRC 10061 / NRRL Y-12695) TaxID=559304 RepID=G8YU35_PICSO|nr:Piso0_000477 [Millerozyma farinosa CBS 7064]CCE73436.1 Piso0_000477 [Millerozyma farinosa CBS 7064]
MLRSKQINGVLKQGLRNVPSSSVGPRAAVLSISLLSTSGTPLATVHDTHLEQAKITEDDLRVYTLIGVRQMKENEQQQADRGEEKQKSSSWEAIQIDDNLQLIIQEIPLGGSSSHNEGDNKHENGEGEAKPGSLYVVLFYSVDYPHEIAKLKVDSICSELAKKLEGFQGDI